MKRVEERRKLNPTYCSVSAWPAPSQFFLQQRTILNILTLDTTNPIHICVQIRALYSGAFVHDLCARCRSSGVVASRTLRARTFSLSVCRTPARVRTRRPKRTRARAGPKIDGALRDNNIREIYGRTRLETVARAKCAITGAYAQNNCSCACACIWQTGRERRSSPYSSRVFAFSRLRRRRRRRCATALWRK